MFWGTQEVLGFLIRNPEGFQSKNPENEKIFKSAKRTLPLTGEGKTGRLPKSGFSGNPSFEGRGARKKWSLGARKCDSPWKFFLREAETDHF